MRKELQQASMVTVQKYRWIIFSLGLWAAGPITAPAVLFYSTGAPDYNTTAPIGPLAASGWQFEGNWGSFLGTAIAPHFFMAAKHVGGNVGDLFALNGTNYTTIAYFDEPNSDLRIWRIRESIPNYALLYPFNDEAGKGLVVIGRGTQRGAEVVVTNSFGPNIKGWQWGIPDSLKRWGQNQVDSAVDGGVGLGSMLRMNFKATGGPNEAHLSGGDSSGAVFIQDGPIWKLAGINSAVDGPFNTTTNGPGFEAALFDAGGLYVMDDQKWIFTPELSTAQPSSFYATRISAHLDWIQAILASANGPLLLSAPAVWGPYQVEINAALNPAMQAITITKPAAMRFYKLQDVAMCRIVSLQLKGDKLVMTYAIDTSRNLANTVQVFHAEQE